MHINYSVNPRRNPSEKGTPPKFYAKVQTRGTVSFDTYFCFYLLILVKE